MQAVSSGSVLNEPSAAEAIHRATAAMTSSSEKTFLLHFTLAGSATALATIGSNPMEVVKTRMQLQGELLADGGRRIYKNFFHAFYTIVKQEGVRGIQRGLVAGMSYNVAMNGVRLGGFESLQKLVGATDPSHPSFFARNVVAGAMSGSIAALFGSPFFLVKARIQAQSSAACINAHYNYTSMMDGFHRIVQAEGPRGLFRGVQGQIPRLAVGTAAQLSTYTSSKNLVMSWMNVPEDTIRVHIASSFISGLAITTCMHPFDVVATRLSGQQVGPMGRGLLYDGVVDCFQKTVAAEGPRGLFKGWTAHYLRVGPHTLLSFLLWEQFKRLASSSS
ncbi:Aste57867_11305 [Aphanomyces stellatus]|uniref:Aste57867_11305 protein n=1 Tax=Aphanomyces stellatus TaxID=120398 RepID=A0A485KT54_9STRA|nr:hypothetical protein As57867_011263 [Aphanomyces stellatus]VFT88167.1 Aste57867_11305 [Aphanomyces stellatus]